MKRTLLLFVISILLNNTNAQTTKKINILKEKNSTSIAGVIKGSQFIDYQIQFEKGQTIEVLLTGSNQSNYFNILPPGSKDVAIYNSSINGNKYNGLSDRSGLYTIRVYLMRNAARRNESSKFTLKIKLRNTGTNADAKVPGTKFHATGELRYSIKEETTNSRKALFGVIRKKTNEAELHITLADNQKRILLFNGNKVTSGNNLQKLKFIKESDMWLIDINDTEHYQIPDAVINGS